jgi:hypothetical protein
MELLRSALKGLTRVVTSLVSELCWFPLFCFRTFPVSKDLEITVSRGNHPCPLCDQIQAGGRQTVAVQHTMTFLSVSNSHVGPGKGPER